MEYWISRDDVQLGPYSLQQLQLMWQQGTLTTDTFYYDEPRAEWLSLRELMESASALFTAEEAFVRLGESRLKGRLSISSKAETLHVFVEGGFVICAMSGQEQGEFVLSRALRLENSTYEWFLNSAPTAANLRLNITEYALKNSIARDVRIANSATRKHNTVALPKVGANKADARLTFHYVLMPEEGAAPGFKLVKPASVVGREEYCDLVIKDSQISRKHCLMEIGEQFVKVKDLGSSNGTQINGIPIEDGFLRLGDQLSLGGFKVILQKEQMKAPAMG